MSDFFGIGAAIRGCVGVYFQSARGTGRTQSMLESLQDGDRVVFLKADEAMRVEHWCKEQGLDVECRVCSIQSIWTLGTSKRRTILDHSWVEQFYREGLDDMDKALERLERHLSGWQEAHRETRRKAKEIAKWRI